MKALNDPYDKRNCYLSLFPGAGGDDAKDFSEMLLSMYRKYAESRGWKVLFADDRELYIQGEYAYGYLKNESGVHRLVRISPFSSKKLRHTSFALVEVIPELPEIDAHNFSIPPEDLKIELARSSGPGGQNVNKRETAVRIVHLPTGIAASSQMERSQPQNKDRALSMVKAKLIRLMEEKKANELSSLRTKVAPEWGNQIRSYVLHPYQQIKDHRTGVISHQPDRVLEGDLDKFLESELEK